MSKGGGLGYGLWNSVKGYVIWGGIICGGLAAITSPTASASLTGTAAVVFGTGVNIAVGAVPTFFESVANGPTKLGDLGSGSDDAKPSAKATPEIGG